MLWDSFLGEVDLRLVLSSRLAALWINPLLAANLNISAFWFAASWANQTWFGNTCIHHLNQMLKVNITKIGTNPYHILPNVMDWRRDTIHSVLFTTWINLWRNFRQNQTEGRAFYKKKFPIFFRNVSILKAKERLRNCSRLKESKGKCKIRVKSDPRLNHRPEENVAIKGNIRKLNEVEINFLLTLY